MWSKKEGYSLSDNEHILKIFIEHFLESVAHGDECRIL